MNVTNCPACGAAFAVGERFCKYCGKPLPEPEQPKVEVYQEVVAAPKRQARVDAYATAMRYCPLTVTPERVSPHGPALAEDEFLLDKYPRLATTHRVILALASGALTIRDLSDLRDVELVQSPKNKSKWLALLRFAQPDEKVNMGEHSSAEAREIQLDFSALLQYVRGRGR